MAEHGPGPQRLPLSVGEEVLDDPFDRVRGTRWTDSVAGAGWSHGTSMTDVLGIPRYGGQGGDRGAFVSAGLGHRHGGAMVGIHLNFPSGIPGTGSEMTDDERRWIDDQRGWLAEEGGYIAVQGTRPQTIGFALNDSPVGLLAWIVEKWRAWSDCRGDIQSCFTKSELLTNATIYWITQTIRSSMHYYYEHRVDPPVALRPERIEVPTGIREFFRPLRAG
jgi:microsomal epoxide hydrolase